MTGTENFESWFADVQKPAMIKAGIKPAEQKLCHDVALMAWQAALASQQPADDGRNEMLSMPDMVTAQDMRETLNILLHEEEAEAAATGFNQCLMECAPIYEAYIRRSRCIDELVKELDGMQESLNAKHRSFVAARNRADLAEKKLAALASQQPADDVWIEWAGGECPVNINSLVNVRYKNGGGDLESRRAEVYNWSHNDKDCYPIIAYRVVKP